MSRRDGRRVELRNCGEGEQQSRAGLTCASAQARRRASSSDASSCQPSHPSG